MRTVLDTENTIYQIGNPFSRRNRCCAIAYSVDGQGGVCLPIEHSGPVTADTLDQVKGVIDQSTLLIGFNFKYDLHWLRRYDIISYDGVLNKTRRVWDCQVAQFVIENQQNRYPSLEGSCEYFGIKGKFKDIVDDYWSKGIDTPDIPWEIVEQRGRTDVELNWKLFEAQQKYLEDKPGLMRLIKLLNMDLVLLAEMEWNGLIYDTEESKQRAEKLQQEIDTIDKTLRGMVGSGFNFNSGDHLSAILYGGLCRYVEKEPYEHTYKSGPKSGLTETRFHHKKIEKTLPRLVTPLKGTELKKDGYWSTDDSVLKRLRAKGSAKKIVDLIRKRSELERLVSTYLRGFPEKISDMDWPEGELHGQINQCVAITGRTSSSNPNLQNIPPEVNELVKTRY